MYGCSLFNVLGARYPLSCAGLPGSLSHISTIKSKPAEVVKGADPEATSVVSIGTGLPPVPKKLVTRIQAGEYIDMAELLPDRLGISAGPVAKDDKQSSKPKRRQVTNILEWIQCFGIYSAVLTPRAHTGSFRLPSPNCRSLHGVQL